jgi:transmembrane sensor
MKGTRPIGEGIKSHVLESGQNADGGAGAVRWFHRFLDTDVAVLPEEELADWAEWAEANPHLEQFRTLGRIWGWHLRGAANESGPRPSDSDLAADEYDDSVPFSKWIAERSSKKRKVWRPGPLTVFLAVAACITALTGAFLQYGNLLQSLEELPYLERLLGEHVQSYTTRASERQDFWLSDRSRITLGAQTELTVHYTANRRFIFLDRGEASFSVVHDPRRPFTVLAGGGAITAVGTQFDVRRELDTTQGERVVVTVSSGTVEVGPPMATITPDVVEFSDISKSIAASALKRRSQPEWTPARLVKGQELTYGTDGPQGKIERVNLEEVAAWKEGRLEYRHEPFKTVIPRVNRYSQKPIVLEDGELGELTYSGTVFEGQVNDWLHALQTLYPIKVTETADHFVLHYDRDRDRDRDQSGE